MNNSPPASTPEPGPKHPIRTLLVDDVEAIRAMMETYLTRNGIVEVVGHATNGAEAVAQTLRLRPDLVIMDIRMPVMDGVAATRQIKQMINPPRIIVVSVAEASSESIALKAGADAFCPKQTAVSTLADRITALFRC
jgi:DNA-binding NarL/FixJ family response regulator